MKHQLRKKYSTNQLMLRLFTGDVCKGHSSSQYSHLPLTWLTSQSCNSLFDWEICVRLPWAWTLRVFVPCCPGYAFITLNRKRTSRVRPALDCFQAASVSLLSFVLMVSGCTRREHRVRVESSEICSPVRTGATAWLNKEPIHAFVDFLCSLIHCLRWTLLFAGTTNGA